ncbi:SDR family NAD(P)-dependent oxidoreductase [Flexivirga meconopsidis]|uniref:SDR family NAD(P)-dependent oxidoreductase n=1 Tax=Flexivirga meconopsidis TaxID=2977121 RepID=UPI00223FD5E1|nr:SDR family oxidoreductase [Flexivirga meconopsidis]
MTWPAGEAAFVTGAASGIGLGIARALVAQGAKVALADVDAERLAAVERELTAAGGTVTTVRLDVGDADGWTAAADAAEQAIGPISILVNNAGVNGGGAIEQTPLKSWRWVFAVNVEGQFLGVSTFLPRFKRRGGAAHILNTASVAGLLPMVNVGAYVSSKFASVGFSMALRDELRGSDITVSLLTPGTVATAINRNAAQAEAALLGTKVDEEAVEANGGVLAQGADPDLVGEQVVDAMRQRQFLIVTHREFGPLVRRVHEEVEAAFEDFDGRYGPDPAGQLMLGGADAVTRPK